MHIPLQLFVQLTTFCLPPLDVLPRPGPLLPCYCCSRYNYNNWLKIWLNWMRNNDCIKYEQIGLQTNLQCPIHIQRTVLVRGVWDVTWSLCRLTSWDCWDSWDLWDTWDILAASETSGTKTTCWIILQYLHSPTTFSFQEYTHWGTTFKMGFPRKSDEICIPCCARVCKYL